MTCISHTCFPFIWQKNLYKSQKRFLEIMRPLAKFGNFSPVFADSRYKLLKYTGTLFRTGNPNIVIIFSVCNDMFPWRFNCLNSIGLIICCNDPSFSTVAWDNNAGIICFFEPCGKESFEVGHIPCYGSSMSRARENNGTGSSLFGGDIAI